VQTPKGAGRIFDAQILTQQVMVQLSERERESFPLKEVSPLPGPPEGVTWHIYRPPLPGEAQQQQGRPGDRGRPSGPPNRQGQNPRRERPDRPARHEDSRNRPKGRPSGPTAPAEAEIPEGENDSLPVEAEEMDRGPTGRDFAAEESIGKGGAVQDTDNRDDSDNASESSQDKDQP
jgi:hypothetical protein